MSDTLSILSRLTDWQNMLDVGLVTLVFFFLLRLFRGTQAVQLLRGLLVIGLVILVITRTVELTAFSWLLSSSSIAIFVAIPVIFQPELRRALERVGRGLPFLTRRADGAATQEVVSVIVRTCTQLADNRHGALIILEGATGLGEYIDRGVPVDGEVTAEMLLTIFFPNTALHDGAVIVRGSRIAAAGCVLPLTSRDSLDSQLGTRHRAAIGVTEQSDALSIVVSEETGAISVARNGRIVRRLDDNRLRRILTDFFDPRSQPDVETVESLTHAE
ncbi:MAG: TIGR00159 family protein [Chloroflexi bacterium]|nr:MAG: TIGR00159 family protein [Chloroflexota bacterium]